MFLVVLLSLWTWHEEVKLDNNYRDHGAISIEDRSGSIDRTEQLKESTSVGQEDFQKEVQVLFALELHRNLTPAEKTEITKQVNWLGRLDGKTLLVRTTLAQRNVLLEKPYVKSVADYSIDNKKAAGIDVGASEAKAKNSLMELVVTLIDPADRDAVVVLANALAGKVKSTELAGTGRYLRIQLPADEIDKLAVAPEVLYVESDIQPEFLNDRVRDIIGARPLAIAQFITPEGLRGKGQMIALADSGLDSGVLSNLPPDLENNTGSSPRVVAITSLTGTAVPSDVNGHGTHMAGTLVGSGKASGGQYTGVAPDAGLYFQGIVDEDQNLVPPLDLQNLFTPAYRAGVRIHVNGWGKKQNSYVSTSAQIDDFARKYPDFLIIFGAGNSGPQEGSITAEANSKNALTIGASVSPRPAFENVVRDSGEIASFSSRGPTVDGRIKPELIAPGTSVISTASRLIDGALTGRPDYTILQGTSMATATAGGASALLRQYFEEYANLNPSSALLKAALINGARVTEQYMDGAGFGQLDISSTIIALQNGLFQVVDSTDGLTVDNTAVYQTVITHSDAPFKATLVWNDPAALPGAKLPLVNNLDLMVTDPQGKLYYGNDFDGQKGYDTINNVEQVYIPHPVPGNYIITIRAGLVQRDVNYAPGVNQDYALVYGQSLTEVIAASVDTNTVNLFGQGSLTLPGDTIGVVNDRLLEKDEKIPAGADLYLKGAVKQPEKVYSVSRNFEINGVKALVNGERLIITHMNETRQEGGYAVDQGVKHLFANQEVSSGVSIMTLINPHTQTIFDAVVSGQEISGVLAEIDLNLGKFQLLNNQQVFSLAEEIVLSFSDTIVSGDLRDIPFGASSGAELANLATGMPVQITVDKNNTIYHLMVNRHVTVGRVLSAQISDRTLTLSSGDSYHVLPGIKMSLNGLNAQLSDIQEGTLVMLDLAPGSNEVLNLVAYTEVSYGRVIYATQDTLYLLDNTRNFISLQLTPESRISRWGMTAGTSILSPGQWVRVITDANTQTVLQVDIAESDEGVVANLIEYNPDTGCKLSDGEIYRLSSASVLTKNDWPIQPQDLMADEPVRVTLLYGPAGEKIVAMLEAETALGVKAPELTIFSSIPLSDFSLISGHTTASKLYIVYPDNTYQMASLTESGDFYYPVKAGDTENVKLVALNETDGGLTGLQLSLPRLQKNFTDISGHWSEMDIRNLASLGMISGYPDNSFKPGRQVTRVEFTVLIARLMGDSTTENDLLYEDADEVPDWAKNAVAESFDRGMVMGYEDNTFRPHNSITREEAAVMLVRIYTNLTGIREEQSDAGYADQESISSWAAEDVNQARLLGLLTGKDNNLFYPQDFITRDETAAAVNRLLNQLTQNYTIE